MNGRPVLLDGAQWLARLGLMNDPLITSMVRQWSLLPNAAGPSVWKGRCGAWRVRLWTGGGTDAHRTRNGRYRLAFGEHPSDLSLRFHRCDVPRAAGDPRRSPRPPDGRPAAVPPSIRICRRFQLEAGVDPSSPACDRIAEIIALVSRLSGSVEAITCSPRAVQLEIAAALATDSSLAHDAALALDLVELDAAPSAGRIRPDEWAPDRPDFGRTMAVLPTG